MESFLFNSATQWTIANFIASFSLHSRLKFIVQDYCGIVFGQEIFIILLNNIMRG